MARSSHRRHSRRASPSLAPLPVRRGLRHYAHRLVMAPPRYVRILVAPFAASLLAGDLPGLRPERLDATTAFVAGRVHTMPSPVRAGVVLVAGVVRAVMLLPRRDRLVRLIGDHPLPLIGEYARLVRSLGFAYVWETWPDTRADGSAPVEAVAA